MISELPELHTFYHYIWSIPYSAKKVNDSDKENKAKMIELLDGWGYNIDQ